ncbi:MAG TPA: ORF6N domain-containing protein [Patescibacteria group bacterium]
MNELLHLEFIEEKIYIVRNRRVMIDSDLAALYGISPKRLNEQVKRNIQRFPSDLCLN